MSAQIECFENEPQTLFLGCSVMSFSTSAGINEQQSQLTVQLVEDECEPPAGKTKKYYNCALKETDWTQADPGFFGESCSIIGTPVYFRVGNFEYSGIVQGWERVNSQSNYPTYEVTIVDPRTLLENVKIIMNDDTGPEPGLLQNLFNALYWNESQRPGVGELCPAFVQDPIDGVIAGSLAGYYGAANSNNNGLTWDDVLWMVQSRINSVSLINNADKLQFLNIGGTCLSVEGMGLLDASSTPKTSYLIDLSELPSVPSYYRFDQTSASLLELISQVLEDTGSDYYIELLPSKVSGTSRSCTTGDSGEDYDLVIKVRTIDRQLQVANNGSISQFVQLKTDTPPDTNPVVISYNEGREFRNDITQTMILGGQKQSVYQAENIGFTYNILPYFGIDPSTKDVIVPTLQGNGYWTVELPTNDLALQLKDARYGLAIPSTLVVTEQEMIMAQSSFDVWHSWASYKQTPLFLALSVTSQGVNDLAAINKLFGAINANPNNNARVADFINATSRGFQGHGNLELEILNIAYAWLNKIVSEYYGKAFQVIAPFTCTKISLEAQAFINSEQPSDAGWTEDNLVIGMPNPSEYMDFFRKEDDNRILPIIGFNNSLGVELTGLSQDSYATNGTLLWVKANVESEYVFLDYSSQTGPRFVVKLPQQLRIAQNENNVTVAFNSLISLARDFGAGAISQANAEAAWQDMIRNVGAIDLHEAVLNRAILPDGAALPIKSNLLRYGPWYATGIGTVGGDLSVKVEDGLVPWEYYGFTTLNTAGNLLSAEGITKQQVIDKGTVTVAGYPEIPLGAEILSIENGSIPATYEGRGSTSRVNIPIRTNTGNSCFSQISSLAPWTGADGANVTNITCRVSPQGIQTTYTMRVYTDKFGRFAKLNAKRLKTISKWRLALTTYIRAFNRQRVDLFRSQILNSVARPSMLVNSRWGAGSKTPSEVLVGQLGQWNNGLFQRPFVAQMPIHEACVEVAQKYDEKAFMSVDGLIRPISVLGLQGNLPRFAQKSEGCQSTTSKGSQSPVDISGEAGQLKQYNLDIHVDYLNPFSNPSTSVPNRTDTPDHGHDIEILGRSSTPPTGSLNLAAGGLMENDSFEESDYSSDNDYRGFALRGPILLQSWGYDLDGFPIPNFVDSDSAANDGTFESTDLQHKFMDNFLRKSETWPVAPIDLRFDRERAVWTIPQYRDVYATLDEDISPDGSGTAIINSGPTLYDSGGNSISNAEIKVYDKLGASYCSGDKIVARFDPNSCEYYVVEHNKQNTLCVEDSDCCIPDSFRISSGSFSGDNTKIVFAKGLRAFTGEGEGIDECSEASGTGNCGPCGERKPDLYLMSGLSVTNSTDVASPIIESGDFINTVNFGSGLNVGSGADNCGIVVSVSSVPADMCIGSVDQCITGILPTGCQQISEIYLGKGLRGETGVGNKLNMGAGVSFSFIDSCVTGNEDVDFANSLNIANGLRVASGDSPCEATLGAGIDIFNSGECLPTGAGTNADFVNKLYLADGLKVRDGGDCIAQMGAGFSVENPPLPVCISFDDETDAEFVNKLVFQKGVTASGNDDTCEVHIGAGMYLVNSIGCVTGQTDLNSANQFNFLDGLRVDSGNDPCEANIGAGFSFSGDTGCLTSSQNIDFANKIVSKDGIRMSGDTGTCTVNIAAGIDISSSGTEDARLCINRSNENPASFANKFVFQKGIYVSGDDATCTAHIGAGIRLFNDTEKCITGVLSDPPQAVNMIRYAKGLRTQTGLADCDAYVGAGFAFSGDVGCIAGNKETSFANNVIALDGLRVSGEPDSCDVRIGAGMYFTGSNETGTGDGNAKVDFANKIYLGSGLEAFESGDCGILITATGNRPCAITSDECVTGDLNDCTKFAKIEFAKGLHAKVKGSFFTTEDHIQVGAGFAFSNQGTECIGTVDKSDTTTANDFTLGAGLRGKSGATDCEYTLAAGPNFSGTDSCYTGELSANNFGSKILLGAGLKGSGNDDECEVGLSAGIEFISSSSQCVTGTSVKDFINKLTLGKGIYSETGDGCDLVLGAGISTSNGAGCDTGNGEAGLAINTLKFMGGLVSNKSGDCTSEIFAGFEFSNSNSTGNGTPTPISFANKVQLGKGLAVTTGGDCEALIYSTGQVEACSDDVCVTQNDTDCLGVDKIVFGKGLWKQDSIVIAGQTRVGAGFAFSNTEDAPATGDTNFANTIKVGKDLGVASGANCEAIIYYTGEAEITGCSSDDCVLTDDAACTGFKQVTFGAGLHKEDFAEGEIKVGAGIDFTNSSTCISGTEALDFVSSIELGKGLYSKSLGGCSGQIGAAVSVVNSGGCVDSTEDVDIANTLNLGDGLRVKSDGDCAALLGAGISASNEAGCVATTENVDFFNKLKARDGIRVKSGDACEAEIGAGVDFISDSTCVTGSDALTFINKIKLGKGLYSKTDSDCTGIIGAAMTFSKQAGCITSEIAGPKIANEIKLADGLKLQDDTDCSTVIGAGLDFTNSTTCVTGSESLNFVNKIELGKGLYSVDLGSCSGRIGAAISLTDSSDCADTGQDVSLANDLIMGAGLRAKSGATDCEALLSAGISFTSNADTPDPTDVTFANAITLGKGLLGATGAANCEATIYTEPISGCSDDVCVTENDTACSGFRKITFGKGINKEDFEEDHIKVGAGFAFSSDETEPLASTDTNFASSVKLGYGLGVSSGDCEATIYFTGFPEACSDDICVTTNDAACTGFKKITFGKGINKQDVPASNQVKVGAGFSFSNSEAMPATGDISFANEIVIGKGLAVSSGAGCVATIYSTGEAGTISGCSDDSCVTVNDTACTGFEKITFGRGINKEDVPAENAIKVAAGISGTNEVGCVTSAATVGFFNQLYAKDGLRLGAGTSDCQAEMSAGISGTNEAGCVTSEATVGFFNKLKVKDGLKLNSGGTCEAEIGAGISITNSPNSGCVTASNNAFVNKLIFGLGLSSQSAGTCESTIVAGPRVSGGDFCKPPTAYTAGAAGKDLTNDLVIGSGLRVGDGDTDCQTKWAAGINFTFDNTECPTDWIAGDESFINNIRFIGDKDQGWGITGTQDGEADCLMKVAVGNRIVEDDRCVKQAETRPWVNRLKFGRGLTAGSGDGDLPCEATIELGLSWDGVVGSKITTIGTCKPTATQVVDGDCKTIQLEFNDKVENFQVVTDVIFGACDVILEKTPITFCGTTGTPTTGSIAQLTDCLNEEGCPCPTG